MTWLTILRTKVAGSSRQAVADELDVSRTTISLVLDGKYPAKTDKIAAKVMDMYARVTCPHTGVEITHAECRITSTAATPTSSPQAMRQWRACQSCQLKGGKHD
jgi:lambda repressor-like predicted transcriptional regulator